MKGNEDIYQLKELQPGFAPESASLAYRNIDCGEYTLHTEGNFDLRWVGDELHVLWQGQSCVAKPCGGSFQPDCFQINGSLYAVDVRVIGPRGVDPWTGKPAAMVTSQ